MYVCNRNHGSVLSLFYVFTCFIHIQHTLTQNLYISINICGFKCAYSVQSKWFLSFFFEVILICRPIFILNVILKLSFIVKNGLLFNMLHLLCWVYTFEPGKRSELSFIQPIPHGTFDANELAYVIISDVCSFLDYMNHFLYSCLFYFWYHIEHNCSIWYARFRINLTVCLFRL